MRITERAELPLSSAGDVARLCATTTNRTNLRSYDGRLADSDSPVAAIDSRSLWQPHAAACSATVAKSKSMDMLRWTAPTEVL